MAPYFVDLAAKEMYSPLVYLAFAALILLLCVASDAPELYQDAADVLRDIVAELSVVSCVFLVFAGFSIANLLAWFFILTRPVLPSPSEIRYRVKLALESLIVRLVTEATRRVNLARESATTVAWGYINALKQTIIAGLVSTVSALLLRLVLASLRFLLRPFMPTLLRKYHLEKNWLESRAGDFVDWYCAVTTKRKLAHLRFLLQRQELVYAVQSALLARMNQKVKKAALDTLEVFNKAPNAFQGLHRDMVPKLFKNPIAATAPEAGPLPKLSLWTRFWRRGDWNVIWAEENIRRFGRASRLTQASVKALEDELERRFQQRRAIEEDVQEYLRREQEKWDDLWSRTTPERWVLGSTIRYERMMRESLARSRRNAPGFPLDLPFVPKAQQQTLAPPGSQDAAQHLPVVVPKIVITPPSLPPSPPPSPKLLPAASTPPVPSPEKVLLEEAHKSRVRFHEESLRQAELMRRWQSEVDGYRLTLDAENRAIRESRRRRERLSYRQMRAAQECVQQEAEPSASNDNSVVGTDAESAAALQKREVEEGLRQAAEHRQAQEAELESSLAEEARLRAQLEAAQAARAAAEARVESARAEETRLAELLERLNSGGDASAEDSQHRENAVEGKDATETDAPSSTAGESKSPEAEPLQADSLCAAQETETPETDLLVGSLEDVSLGHDAPPLDEHGAEDSSLVVLLVRLTLDDNEEEEHSPQHPVVEEQHKLADEPKPASRGKVKAEQLADELDLPQEGKVKAEQTLSAHEPEPAQQGMVTAEETHLADQLARLSLDDAVSQQEFVEEDKRAQEPEPAQQGMEKAAQLAEEPELPEEGKVKAEQHGAEEQEPASRGMETAIEEGGDQTGNASSTEEAQNWAEFEMDLDDWMAQPEEQLSEQQRLAAEAEQARFAVEVQAAHEAAELQRRAEEERLAQLAAERARVAALEALAEQERQHQQNLAELRRATEEWEEQRRAAEQRRLFEEEQRRVEELRQFEERRRLEEQRRLEEEQRLLEEQRRAEELRRLEEQRRVEELRRAEEQRRRQEEALRRLDEQSIAHRAAMAQRQPEQKRAAEEYAAARRAEQEQWQRTARLSALQELAVQETRAAKQSIARERARPAALEEEDAWDSMYAALEEVASGPQPSRPSPLFRPAPAQSLSSSIRPTTPSARAFTAATLAPVPPLRPQPQRQPKPRPQPPRQPAAELRAPATPTFAPAVPTQPLPLPRPAPAAESSQQGAQREQAAERKVLRPRGVKASEEVKKKAAQDLAEIEDARDKAEWEHMLQHTDEGRELTAFLEEEEEKWAREIEEEQAAAAAANSAAEAEQQAAEEAQAQQNATSQDKGKGKEKATASSDASTEDAAATKPAPANAKAAAARAAARAAALAEFRAIEQASKQSEESWQQRSAPTSAAAIASVNYEIERFLSPQINGEPAFDPRAEEALAAAQLAEAMRRGAEAAQREAMAERERHQAELREQRLAEEGARNDDRAREAKRAMGEEKARKAEEEGEAQGGEGVDKPWKGLDEEEDSAEEESAGEESGEEEGEDEEMAEEQGPAEEMTGEGSAGKGPGGQAKGKGKGRPKKGKKKKAKGKKAKGGKRRGGRR